MIKTVTYRNPVFFQFGEKQTPVHCQMSTGDRNPDVGESLNCLGFCVCLVHLVCLFVLLEADASRGFAWKRFTRENPSNGAKMGREDQAPSDPNAG